MQTKCNPSAVYRDANKEVQLLSKMLLLAIIAKPRILISILERIFHVYPGRAKILILFGLDWWGVVPLSLQVSDEDLELRALLMMGAIEDSVSCVGRRELELYWF